MAELRTRAPEGAGHGGWRGPAERVAWCVLFVLASSAIFAPLIASDLPYKLRAVDQGSYEGALRTLTPITESLGHLVQEGPLQDVQRWRARCDAELGALSGRLELLARDLDPEPRAQLAGVSDALAELRDSLDGPQRARRQAASVALAERVGVARAELSPERLEQRGWSLRAHTSWPLFAALPARDVWLMAAWAAGLLLFFSSRLRGRWPAPLQSFALLFGLAGALTLLHSVLVSAPSGGRSLKADLTEGRVLAESVLMPPVFYGFAETHTEESLKGPSWRSDERSPALTPEEGMTGEFARTQSEVEVRFGEPSADSPWRHLAGTDALGRDLFARLLWGGRVSLAVGFCAALFLTVIGIVVGALAGFLGGWVDGLVTRAIEIVLSIPALFLIVLAAAYVDPNALHPVVAIVGIIALVSWTGVARLVRAELLRLREAEFVLAARAMGLAPWRVLCVHALPNALSPALVAAAFAVGGGILTESVVSYLGFGVRHPLPSWGALINESRSAEHWWIQLLPGLAIFLAVTATNLIGEALRDRLDPRAEGPRP